MTTRLYTTRFEPAKAHKPETIHVYVDMLPTAISSTVYQQYMPGADNHRYAVHRYFMDEGPSQTFRIVASGNCLNGYWFAVEY
jgi:hypothetical protein